MDTVKKRRKAVIDKKICVACGCCVKVCPLHIIEIKKGSFAHINEENCVGCGKCAKECPASIISIKEVE